MDPRLADARDAVDSARTITDEAEARAGTAYVDPDTDTVMFRATAYSLGMFAV